MNRKFWLLTATLLVLMLALEYNMPRRFQWEPTFAHADKQPFGCYVFDSVLSQTMPNGYTVCRKTLSQLALQDTTPRAIIILHHNFWREGLQTDTLLTLAQRGCRILIAASTFPIDLGDTLGTDIRLRSRFKLKDIQDMRPQRDSIFWTGDTLHYPATTFRVFPQLVSACIWCSDSIPHEPLAMIIEEEEIDSDEHEFMDVKNPIAISYPIGRGELILVTTPLLLTNYGMLDCPAYVHRLMNRLQDLPTVRTEAYMPNTDMNERSPFRELLKRPPLRWALYLVLLGVVLLMTLTARRRQRAIPVEQPPRNYQLDFIRHIGTLQYKKEKT